MGVQVWGIIGVTFLYKLSCRITNAEIIATLISYDFLSLIHTIYCAFYDLTRVIQMMWNFGQMRMSMTLIVL